MGTLVTETWENWGDGVITSLEPDRVPPTASPKGWNSALTAVGGGQAVVQKRLGCRTLNSTPISSSPQILGLYAYSHRHSDGTLEEHDVVVSADGRFSEVSTSGGLTTVSATAFNAGTDLPDFTTSNNLCFIANGQAGKNQKYDGTALTKWGIARPSVPTAVAGAAGAMTGDYEVKLTYYNSDTGHESSSSDAIAVTGLTSDSIDVTIPDTTATDPQITHVRVYIRKTNPALTALFYRVTSGTGYVSAAGGWPEGHGTLNIDLSDAQLLQLILPAPSTSENDPPPDGIRFLTVHRNRVFAADDAKVYYSKVGLPEAFSPTAFEVANTDDGQKITGLHAVDDLLLIFKSNSLYALYGDDPQTWIVRLVDPQVGCVANRSVQTVEGVTYWWSEEGPVQWAEGARPQPIALELLAPTVGTDALNYEQLGLICAEVDFPRQRLLFAVPELQQTRCTVILPFNYRLQRWESDKWDPMDTSALGRFSDATGQPWVVLGGYAGQMFRVWSSDNDGVESGTTTGTFTTATSTITTITDAGAAFATAGGGLVERKLTLITEGGVEVTSSIRPRITANTATSITFTSAVTGLTVGTTYRYIIGGPNFEWDLAWTSAAQPFRKKRWEFLYVAARSTGPEIDLQVDFAHNFDTRPSVIRSVNFTTSADAGVWDVSEWDVGVFAGRNIVTRRLRIGRVSQFFQPRFINRYADQPVTLVKAGFRAELLGDKVG